MTHRRRAPWRRSPLVAVLVGVALAGAACGADPTPIAGTDDTSDGASDSPDVRTDGPAGDGDDPAPDDGTDTEGAVPDGASEIRLVESTSVSVGDLELSTSVRGEGADAVAVLTVYDLRDETTPFEVVELAAGDTATVFDHELTAVAVAASTPRGADVEGGHDGGVDLVVLPPA